MNYFIRSTKIIPTSRTHQLFTVFKKYPILRYLSPFTISDSGMFEAGSPVETEIVRVVSFSAKEITEITRLKKSIFRVQIKAFVGDNLDVNQTMSMDLSANGLKTSLEEE